MSVLKDAFEHAILAQAAYSDLKSGMIESVFFKTLTDNGMSEPLASYVSKNYTIYSTYVASGFSNLSGFQAVIFQRKDSNNFIFANRGTEASVGWVEARNPSH